MLDMRRKKKNGCVDLNCKLVVWFLTFLVVSIAFMILVAKVIINSGQLALLAFFIIYLLLLFPILGCYVFLVNKDPVDPHVGNQQYHIDIERQPENTKSCFKCNTYVKLETEHCRFCDRCTDSMYCHSLLLNNCVSFKDYCTFLTLTLSLTLNTLIGMIQSAIVFSERDNEELQPFFMNLQVIGVSLGAFSIGFIYSCEVTLKTCYLGYKGKRQIQYDYQQNLSNNSDDSERDEVFQENP